MAFDEYCLERLASDAPVFYLWRNAPSVIIGLNQSPYAEVNLKYIGEKGIALARRVTGGGAVYHDLNNLNYSITGSARDFSSDGSVLLGTMTAALRKLGLDVERTGRNDILLDGRKCSGYAKRVSRDRIMIHGTLLFDTDLDTMSAALSVPGSKLSEGGVASVRSRVTNLKDRLWEGCTVEDFASALEDIIRDGDPVIDLDSEALAETGRMADGKFRTWEWIYGRSPEATFSTVRKFPCGTVRAAFNLKGGRIGDLSFTGDFLGDLPASVLSEALEGCRFTRDGIRSALEGKGLSAASCFDYVSNDELIDLLVNI